MRQDSDAPTIGLLLCKSKDRLVAEYALSDIQNPMGLSTYTLSHTLPEALAQPHIQALAMAQTIPGETFTLTPLPLTIDGTRPRIAHAAPRLGNANAALGLPPLPA